MYMVVCQALTPVIPLMVLYILQCMVGGSCIHKHKQTNIYTNKNTNKHYTPLYCIPYILLFYIPPIYYIYNHSQPPRGCGRFIPLLLHYFLISHPCYMVIAQKKSRKNLDLHASAVYYRNIANTASTSKTSIKYYILAPAVTA